MNLEAQINLIGAILLDKGLLTKEQLTSIREEASGLDPKPEADMEKLLIAKGMVTEEQLLQAYSEHLGMPLMPLGDSRIEPEAVSMIPAQFANKNSLIAVKKEKDSVTVAMRHPFDIDVLDELRILTRLEILPVLAKEEDIVKAIKAHYGIGAETVERLVKNSETSLPKIDTNEVDSSKDLQEMVKDTSIINYVNQLLREAHEKRVTDIHIEPFEENLRIRYRIDGVLYDVKTHQELKKLQVAIISRIKIMADLNIAERRRPQDGRCKMALKGETLDLRVSTFPTLFGEGVSIRLLSRSSILLGLDQLGLSPEDFERSQSFLKRPNGIVLVTGPTGCGKTTTLYAYINHLNDSRIKIVTLEDPVEYQLAGVNQIQINPKVDLTFATGLRSILRQDPDVIMVGEVRDLETAEISIRAALTGHLIFSTLHTNDAVATITRLLDIGIEKYLVTDTLRAVLAQRLIRLVCVACRQAYVPGDKVIEAVGLDPGATKEIYRSKGCPECGNTGYKGRTAIFELLVIDEGMKDLILSGASESEMREQAVKSGMRPLKGDGMDKVRKGLTTIEEITRVTEQDTI